ncbi:hypothetical protein SDC9_211499 [bioreactor metagenome]|uniref:Uncharacterized protein n=1 Tax=bioreactor metagenome TaxID=1076179 RepID=A0A645JX52_9ZZZZ
MGKIITLIIIAALAGGGYLWYNHAKETRLMVGKTKR